MGRARSSMELIKDKKGRNISFQRRIASIRTKAMELSTLCDLPISMVLYGPQGNVETWASGIDDIDNHPLFLKHMFTMFERQPPDERRKTRVGVPDYFKDRKKKLESQLDKLRLKNTDPKYPDWHPKFDTFHVTELAIMSSTLRNKLEYAKGMRYFVKEDLSQNQNVENQVDQGQQHNDHLFGGEEDYSKALAMVQSQSLDEMMLMNNYYTDYNSLEFDENQPLAMVEPTTTFDPMMPLDMDYGNYEEFGGKQFDQPLAMIKPAGDPMMPQSNGYGFQEFHHEPYNQPLAMIRPSDREGNDYYNMQQFGGNENHNYCNNYNYDMMDSLPNTGTNDSGEIFDKMAEHNYTSLLTCGQIDPALLTDTSLPRLLYEGTDMSSTIKLMSQLLFQYYGDSRT